MEKHDLEAEKKRLAKAERTENPAVATLKLVNYLQLMGDRLPVGTQITGEVLRGLVAVAESRGIEIPGCRWDTMPQAEKRDLQQRFDKIATNLPIPKPFKERTPQNNYSDAELRRKVAQQIGEFERLCAQSDPLVKLADIRAMHPVKPGTMSEEDQQLYDQFNRLKR